MTFQRSLVMIKARGLAYMCVCMNDNRGLLSQKLNLEFDSLKVFNIDWSMSFVCKLLFVEK